MPAAERASVPGIKPARADLILAGAVVVQGVLQRRRLSGLEATEAGLREGVFFERLLGSGESATERPPLFDDVRRASVLNLAGQYHFDSAHTRHVATLALGMFDELARSGCTTATHASANCCGRPACCTTSACRSTTTTTTSIRAT